MVDIAQIGKGTVQNRSMAVAVKVNFLDLIFKDFLNPVLGVV